MDSQKQWWYKLDRIYKFKSREELCNEYWWWEYDKMKDNVPWWWNVWMDYLFGQLCIMNQGWTFQLFDRITGSNKRIYRTITNAMIKPFDWDGDWDFISLDFI